MCVCVSLSLSLSLSVRVYVCVCLRGRGSQKYKIKIKMKINRFFFFFFLKEAQYTISPGSAGFAQRHSSFPTAFEGVFILQSVNKHTNTFSYKRETCLLNRSKLLQQEPEKKKEACEQYIQKP